MKTCERCHREVESLGIAYLTNRVKIENVCQPCAKKLKEVDMQNHATKIIDSLTGIVNGGNTKELAQALHHAFIRQHRHLQGEVMQTLWMFFEQYKDAAHDARNEWAVKYAGRCFDAVTPPKE